MINAHINKIIVNALKEDTSFRDITTNLLIPKDHKCTAYVVVKEPGVLCGIHIAAQVYKHITPRVRFKALRSDGARVSAKTRVAQITGNTRSILKGERAALNFMMHLSGIATLTHQFVKKAGNPKVKIMDTRKTLPGLRLLEKYAVRCGGGANHRMNLNEMILIKDNHLAALHQKQSIAEVLKNIKQRTPKPIEIEVTSMKEFKSACKTAPDFILLDNMKPSCMKNAVVYLNKNKLGHKTQLEASGGITLKNIKAIADTGVDRISIGALTHSAKAINMSIEF